MVMSVLNARDELRAALRQAGSVVTGTPQEKAARLQLLGELEAAIRLAPPGQDPAPSAAELREVLGDPDDRRIRKALRTYEEAERGLSVSFTEAEAEHPELAAEFAFIAGLLAEHGRVADVSSSVRVYDDGPGGVMLYAQGGRSWRLTLTSEG